MTYEQEIKDYKDSYGVCPHDDYYLFRSERFNLVKEIESFCFDNTYLALQRVSRCVEFSECWNEEREVWEIEEKLFKAIEWMDKNRTDWGLHDFIGVCTYDVIDRCYREIPMRDYHTFIDGVSPEPAGPR
jgi:hypothetical protein